MTFNRILVPLDGSRMAEQTLIHAARVARSSGARIHLLRVLETHSADIENCPQSFEWRMRKVEALRYLEATAENMLPADLESIPHLTEGRPAEQICEFIRRNRVDLLMLSAYGAGGETGFPFGGTAQKVLSCTEISHVVIRPNDTRQTDAVETYRRIVVPLDGSQRAEWAVNVASRISNDSTTEIVLLQIVPEPVMPRRRPLTAEEKGLHDQVVDSNIKAGSQYLNDVKLRLGRTRPVRTSLVVSNQVARTIHQVAIKEDADLIVLAALDASDLNGWSHETICRAVLAASSRPVMILQDGLQTLDHELGKPPVDDRADVMARKLCAS